MHTIPATGYTELQIKYTVKYIENTVRITSSFAQVLYFFTAPDDETFLTHLIKLHQGDLSGNPRNI